MDGRAGNKEIGVDLYRRVIAAFNYKFEPFPKCAPFLFTYQQQDYLYITRRQVIAEMNHFC